MEFQKLIITEDSSIIQAMEQLDLVAKKILFILEDGRLKATLTDGDVRRWILSGGDLSESISKVANYRPFYLKKEDQHRANELMKKYGIEAMPIVDEEERLLSVSFWNDENISLEKRNISLPVVMMAGGLGTRLYPYTKILPKPLIPIGEIPIAERIINQFRKYGCNQFFLVVYYKKNMIKAYFNEIKKDYSVSYIDEEYPLGTGGGIALLKNKIHETFILSNCDILIEEDFKKIYEFHKKEKNLITMVCSLKTFTIPYGVIEIGADGQIKNMKEKPEFSFFTNTGCYIVEPRVIDEMKTGRNVAFPDIIMEYKKRNEKVGIYPIGEHAWMDMGQMDTFEEMRARVEASETI